ncbi:biopolymer transporter ExbD [Candidatus Rhabdochlamydia sp. T3358]|jgi:biopolymer transport protein ExbD|uniref:ExbD/TolR family protein n=1 Tax=Candidatus Rhabdochlamydia sp. T3358 TaxID=2099795 RepID=UPI0010BBD834|nr:biopolymer transporter ExbD [Candidatus Rhabdochlamydia sp. T3358]VHO02683.1 Biopolymer transport protein ExbD/TolR [Candidatus Rhabdochlamydia sp. T3358]
MSLIPEEELKRYNHLNLAPMIDFLFLIVAVFAVIAVTRASLFDREISLVKVQTKTDVSIPQDRYTVHLSINNKGEYKWITEFNEYLISCPLDVQLELKKQQELGLLPKDTLKTQVLLHIDKQAMWEPIVQLIFAVKQAGFQIHPVYESE